MYRSVKSDITKPHKTIQKCRPMGVVLLNVHATKGSESGSGFLPLKLREKKIIPLTSTIQQKTINSKCQIQPVSSRKRQVLTQ